LFTACTVTSTAATTRNTTTPY